MSSSPSSSSGFSRNKGSGRVELTDGARDVVEKAGAKTVVVVVPPPARTIPVHGATSGEMRMGMTIIPTKLRNLGSAVGNSNAKNKGAKRQRRGGDDSGGATRQLTTLTTSSAGVVVAVPVPAASNNNDNGSAGIITFNQPHHDSQRPNQRGPGTAFKPHYVCARSTYESTLRMMTTTAAADGGSGATNAPTNHGAADVRSTQRWRTQPEPQAHRPQQHPVQLDMDLHHRQPAMKPPQTTSVVELVQHMVGQGRSDEDIRREMETMLQKQQLEHFYHHQQLQQQQQKQQQQQLWSHPKPPTTWDPRMRRSSHVPSQAPARVVASSRFTRADGVAALPGGAPVTATTTTTATTKLLKPRQSSPAALPSDFVPSKVDIVLELCSESADRATSPSSASDSSLSSSSVATNSRGKGSPANACRRVRASPSFEAAVNRHLLSYIEASRQSRSHLIDHVLALVERTGGLFCRYDALCGRWIQVGYLASFDVCAGEFKAGARDVLKRVQLLRALERQDDHEHRRHDLEVMQQSPPTPIASSSTMPRVVYPPAAPKPKPPPQQPFRSEWMRNRTCSDPRPGATTGQLETLNDSRIRSSRTTQALHSSSDSMTARSESQASDPPNPTESREHKLQTKFKRPKRKAPPYPTGSAPARCELASAATRPPHPLPRRITNEQESSASANM